MNLIRNIMKEIRQPRNKLPHIQLSDFFIRGQNYSVGKGQYVQQMILRKLDIHLQNN